MGNRWVDTPYRFEGREFGCTGIYSHFLVDERGKPLCALEQNEVGETYDVTPLVGNSSKRAFKKIADAQRWCETNDWSQPVREDKSTNGVQSAPRTERQHCPACNTDGEHIFTQNVSMVDLFKCATCGDEHARVVITKAPPTATRNAAVMQAQKERRRRTRKVHDESTISMADNAVAGNGAMMFSGTVMPGDHVALRKTLPLDEIERAAHYNTGNIEVIDAIESWRLDFCLGNAVKYIARAAHKGTELKCLRKARWYLTRRIEQLEQAELDAARARPQ